VIVDVALYQNGLRVEAGSDISDLLGKAEREGGFVWLGLAEPTQAEFDLAAGELNLHPLAVEDAINAKQRQRSKTMRA
jgi:magnesium transporter